MRLRVILDLDLSEILWAMPKARRQEIVATMEMMADSPFIPGDSFSTDDTGRTLHHHTFGRWRFTYWVDGAVNELRILHVRRDS